MIGIYGFANELSASPTVQAIISPVTRFGDMGAQTYWLTYLGSMCTAAVYYLYARRKRFTSLKGVAAYVMPKKLWLHRSTKLDAQLFVIGSMYLSCQGALLFGSEAVSNIVVKGISFMFGPGIKTSSHSLLLGLITPVLLFLALELGYWLAHYLMHRYAWLWEFHKVHHSAEIMTPMTEWRQHPVELFLFPVLMSLSTGMAYGTILWLWGPESHTVPFWTVMTILLAFFFTLLHLRHSHVKMNFPAWLGRILQSPAHHHIHHSTQPHHFNKNMGYCLSVWDWVFGTLALPEKNQKISFGIEHDPAYQTFTGCMLEPFKNLYRRMVGKRNRALDFTPESSARNESTQV